MLNRIFISSVKQVIIPDTCVGDRSGVAWGGTLGHQLACRGCPSWPLLLRCAKTEEEKRGSEFVLNAAEGEEDHA